MQASHSGFLHVDWGNDNGKAASFLGTIAFDNAIHAFAGVQLRLECARLMEEQGHPEPTGMAKVTDAFNLPSKHVIRMVGPIAQGVVFNVFTEREHVVQPCVALWWQLAISGLCEA